MATPLIPQEIYLLERYSSLEYFAQMRDHWEAMVKHVEQCLDVFMQHLPPDYRNRPLPQQPDIVWGERVLPNFRSTLQTIYQSYIQISHGDLSGLAVANGPINADKGQSDFWAGWMGEPQVASAVPDALSRYYEALGSTVGLASNIAHTINGTWATTDLSSSYSESDFGALEPPERWPRYQLSSVLQVKAGEPIECTGIYLPDVDDSCAVLLVKGKVAGESRIGRHAELREPINEPPTTWTLIERVPGETIPQEEGLGPVAVPPPLRISAGQSCPQSGWWFTPASENSRRYFKQGEIFPNIEGSAYGDTFWQWSPDQSLSKL